MIKEPSDLDPAGAEPIELAPALLERLAAIRAEALQTLGSGDPVYGVNTGMGNLSKRRLTDNEQRRHQRNLLLARAAGGPPWLPPEEARAVLIGRLRTFLTGDAAVSVGLVNQLVALINSSHVPAIPSEGAGSAGEIIPLAHAAGPLVGLGWVTDGADVRPAAGLLPPFELGPKEGIALLAGIPGATGRAALNATRARRLADHLTAVSAGAIAVVGANRDPYQAVVGRGDDVLAAELTRLRELAGPEPDPRGLQAPVSFRIAGQVVAHVRRTLQQLDDAVERAFDGVTDSPAYLDGEFVGTAGFHGLDLTAYCDHLTAALAHAAEVSTARLHRLLDPTVTGLHAQLARDPGPQAGLVAVHKRAVAITHQLRRLTLPTAISTAETSNGQEDVQTFSWEAVGNLGEAIRHTRETTACELLAVRQAFALSERPVPPGLQPLLEAVDDVVPPIDADRPFGDDLTAILTHVL
ncbi:histidine ammonia-lyase [Kribbella aluminosa]|uniref:Histidine ammonia-lyase n=1 Tax=Kribbella aluminosa TaxID=416017 RepID=A0ABS4UST0_9ACTN|nr:aromatic amino acid lyase [Kribbella aluminosa]MBP2354697.1 histidine ammonia-lyase [Kribbella aluminosa]